MPAYFVASHSSLFLNWVSLMGPKQARQPPTIVLLLCVVLISVSLLCMPAGANRLVFCHYMLWAPLFSDSVAGFKQDIHLAQSYGIDAFALNTMTWNDEFKRRAGYIYQAAQELGTGFKIFFSADFNSGTGLSESSVVEMLTTYRNHPNQLYYEGKQFLSTFLGQDRNPDVWRNQVLGPAGNNIFFVPFFPTDGTEPGITPVLNQFASVVNGLFAWDTSAWPYINGDYNNPSTRNDQAYLAACGRAGKVYMASISPWFFAHSASCPNPQTNCFSNQVKGNYQGPGLWMERWRQLVQSGVQLVEIVSWNDWAERHYVTPVGTGWGPAPYNDQSFPHQAYLELGAYYIQWFKTGQQPGIAWDALYVFYYTHSKSATARNDPIGLVQHSEVLDDKLYVAVKLTQPAIVRLRSGGASQDFSLGAGVQRVGMPFQQGAQSATLIRNGANVLSINGDLPINNEIQQYNFNVYTKNSTLMRASE